MSAEFKSLREILREMREPRIAPAPAISPLIAEAATVAEPQRDRLGSAKAAERFDRALERLFEEIAAEVLGRELLLAPVDVAAIVERLRKRYALPPDAPVYANNGDVMVGDVDASLGRRVRAAIDRALQ